MKVLMVGVDEKTKGPMILVVNADDLDAEDAVVELSSKFDKHCRVKSRNMTPASLDLILELRTAKGGELVKQLLQVKGITSASLLAHDGEVTF